MENKKKQTLRLGDILLEAKVINDAELAKAIEYQKEHPGVRIGQALTELKLITEGELLVALGKRLNCPVINGADVNVDIAAVSKIPRNVAEEMHIFAYRFEEGRICVLINDPLDFHAIEVARVNSGMEPKLMLTDKATIDKLISFHYSEISARYAANRAAAGRVLKEQTIVNIVDDDDKPIINILNNIMLRAFDIKASDIHVEPSEGDTRIRLRMDGVITDFMSISRKIHNSLIARIKILSDLDIAERRLPQDGHFKTEIKGVDVNVRVSVIPTVFGEKAVLRLLTNNVTVDNREHFGMNKENYEVMSGMLKSPNGIIYLTGPTGSGKSTTLYLMLEELAGKNVNISTIEDPVERNVPRLNQMQVNTVTGLTFENGLRAILRQDPDIIMVGETRDAETAETSVRAAITGHLVFSTLHTNDAASSVVRLRDMGVEPYLVASSLVGVVAQRLMRKVCPYCSSWDEMTYEEEKFVGRKIEKVKRVKGCVNCNHTGYNGRIAIHEILSVDRNVREMIMNNASVDTIKDYAVNNLSMKTLKSEAVKLVEEGVTTVEEMVKVAYYE